MANSAVDILLLDKQLTEKQRVIRDTTRDFCQTELMPGILKANREGTLDPLIMLCTSTNDVHGLILGREQTGLREFY